MLRRDHLGGVDDAVHPVAHVQAIVKRFEVNVRGAQVSHPADDLVDHADDRRFAGEVFEVFYKIARVKLKAGGVIGIVDRVVTGGQRPVNVRLQRNTGMHIQAGGQRQRLEDECIIRRGHGHGEASIVQVQRVHVVGAQKVGLQAFDFERHGRKIITRDKRNAQQLRLGPGHIDL